MLSDQKGRPLCASSPGRAADETTRCAPAKSAGPHRVVVENIAVASRERRVARMKIPGTGGWPIARRSLRESREFAPRTHAEFGALHRGFEMRPLGPLACTPASVRPAAGHRKSARRLFPKAPARDDPAQWLPEGCDCQPSRPRAAVGSLRWRISFYGPENNDRGRTRRRSLRGRTRWELSRVLGASFGPVVAVPYRLLSPTILPAISRAPVLVTHLFRTPWPRIEGWSRTSCTIGASGSTA